MTEWKAISLIPGYEEYVNYEMNADGILRRTVASAWAKAGRVLTPRKNSDGYLIYHVCSNGRRKDIKQHRAIACLFMPNPKQYGFVDHVNGFRDDNRIDNLRWCTRSENSRNAKMPCDNTTGYKNIDKHCDSGKYWFWRIYVQIDGKRIQKRFKCEPEDTEPPAEVIAKRDEMLKELHGEFARSE